jgi:dipeptidyl aminopeptidase/acylaminoacyl peptidase
MPWIKAAAAMRPWMDLSRIGIYGGSAGGQNTLAGLLHHGDFYQAGVADCGCHDNRMDKIWWNEAWMGWPVDESYERNSNVVHADKLRGNLMLIVGELDNNVDPASTAQVVAALQKADKIFDFVPIINAGHGAAETTYGKLRRAEFFVRHLATEAEPAVSP